MYLKLSIESGISTQSKWILLGDPCTWFSLQSSPLCSRKLLTPIDEGLCTSGLLRLVHYMALYLRLLALVGYVPTAVGKTDACIGPLALGREGVCPTTWEH